MLITISTRDAKPLTTNPFYLLIVCVCFLSQLACHLMETLSRICYLSERVEAFTDSLINYES